MKLYIQYLAIISILLSSCSEDSKTLPILDFDNPKGSVNLNLSEMLDDIRLVKLEMNQDEPIPKIRLYWIGKKHLLLFAGEKVYQYTSDGAFVRVLMISGQGPGEFSFVRAYDIDEKKDLLYWSDQGTTGKIFVTDLKSGDKLEPIKLPYDNRLAYGGIKIIDENTLLCLSAKYLGDDIMFYYLGLDGSVTEGLPRYNPDLPYIGRGAFLQKNRKSGKFNLMGDADTLYSIEGNTMEPMFSMLVSDRFTYANNHEGYMLRIRHLGSKYSVLNRNMMIFTQSNGFDRITSDESTDFLLDMRTYTLSTLDSWKVDYLAYTCDELILGAAGDYAVIKFSAIKLKGICEEALLKKDLDPEVRDRMSMLNGSITKNDNPYLLIGKIK